MDKLPIAVIHHMEEIKLPAVSPEPGRVIQKAIEHPVGITCEAFPADQRKATESRFQSGAHLRWLNLHAVMGGDAAVYCPIGDVSVWSEKIVQLLGERSSSPERWAARLQAGLAQAAKFSWAEYARKMVSLYQQLLAS